MIGVIARAEETSAAEEFFQLFKTPWEFFKPGQTYDVIVATVEPEGEIEARLLLIYGSEPRKCDQTAGLTAGSKLRDVLLDYQGEKLPVYGDTLSLRPGAAGQALLRSGSMVAGVKIVAGDQTVVRLGYDLFREVTFLLSAGQPVERASIPALDLHLQVMRQVMIEAGISFLEILPQPADCKFTVCLTHDIDFVGIRRHKFDHSMWGFLYRSSVGAGRDFLRGRLGLGRLWRMVQAMLALPFVYLGWARDFWEPFGWYLRVEEKLPATYFLIPFKKRAGEKVKARHGERRATAYDVGDLEEWPVVLQRAGCEIGVHGIDAWHDAAKGRAELERVQASAGTMNTGIRMHWLLRDEKTFQALESAGYTYDSTVGYNETVGYRAGTAQVYCPPGARTLLELPLHIQDGALFYRQQLDLSEPEAWARCQAMMEQAEKRGGVLTVLWHDRSHGPERFWGGFYERLVERLKSLPVWFATAAQAVQWFRARRSVVFETRTGQDAGQVGLRYAGPKISPPLVLRFHNASASMAGNPTTAGQSRTAVELAWGGEADAQQVASLMRLVPPAGSEPSVSTAVLRCTSVG